MTDFIEFVERGKTFEVQGPDHRGEYLLAVRVGGDIRFASTHADMAEVGTAVDACLDEAPMDPEDRGFGGFEIERWNHETRMTETFKVPTRGALLAWFDDGIMPTVEEAADLAEAAGDVVFVVRDGAGTVLLDRRAEAEASITRMQPPRF